MAMEKASKSQAIYWKTCRGQLVSLRHPKRALAVFVHVDPKDESTRSC